MSENKQYSFSVNFFQGNTNRIGVNYFADEDAVKFGVERTKKLINIFSVKGYTVERIGLCGGVDELSHTGYVSYSVAYTDAKMFCDNAYSDYVIAKEKAKAEYGSCLSSYNFTDFSILFVNVSHSVRVFVGAGKDITIKYDECNEIATDMSQIISDIKKDVYQNNCLVEGAEKIKERLIMNKEELLNQELYFIKSNLTNSPYFVNSEFFVLFTNKALALSFAQRISQRLKPYYSIGGSPVSACIITDNDSFFQEMMSIGFSKFSFNEEGTIFDLNSIYGKENKVSLEEKELYIYYIGYVKMQKSSHIGSVKTQKIASAKQHLSSGNNPKMMQCFIESQKKLRLYYKDMSSADTGVPFKSQETFTPPLTRLGKEKVEQDGTGVSVIDNGNISQQQEKMGRPVAAGILFVLAAMYAFAFIGAIDTANLPGTISYGGAAISYCVLGLVMKKQFLKGFGWAIFTVLFLFTAVDALLNGKGVSTVITLLTFTVIFVGLFAFANRKRQNG